MTMKDVKPLKLTVTRWLVDDEQEAELHFDVTPGLQHAEIELIWGPGARQRRTYSLEESDLDELHDWLREVLGLDKDLKTGT